jgi:hypothetical protein
MPLTLTARALLAKARQPLPPPPYSLPLSSLFSLYSLSLLSSPSSLCSFSPWPRHAPGNQPRAAAAVAKPSASPAPTPAARCAPPERPRATNRVPCRADPMHSLPRASTAPEPACATSEARAFDRSLRRLMELQGRPFLLPPP